MTKLADDHMDPYEPRLTRRVGAFAEQAVRPIDAMAIAASAHAGARRRTLLGRRFGSGGFILRLGVVLAAALAATAFGVFLGAGGTSRAPVISTDATPTIVPGAPDPCLPADLTGRIHSWEGAAGHRIASIRIFNTGTRDCSVPRVMRTLLLDGNGHKLILAPEGLESPGDITVGVGAPVTTLVDMANYCGPTPVGDLSIRLYLTGSSSIAAGPDGSLPFPLDIPPCNGQNAPATIQMQALEPLAPASS